MKHINHNRRVRLVYTWAKLSTAYDEFYIAWWQWNQGGHASSVTNIPPLSDVTLWLKCELLRKLLKMSRTLQKCYSVWKICFGKFLSFSYITANHVRQITCGTKSHTIFWSLIVTKCEFQNYLKMRRNISFMTVLIPFLAWIWLIFWAPWKLTYIH